MGTATARKQEIGCVVVGALAEDLETPQKFSSGLNPSLWRCESREIPCPDHPFITLRTISHPRLDPKTPKPSNFPGKS